MKLSWRSVLFLILLVVLAGCQGQAIPVIHTDPQNPKAASLPAGNYILFMSTRESTPGFYLMAPDGSNVQKLTFPSLPAGYVLNGVKWEPGLKLFVASINDEKNQPDLFVIDSDGTVVSRLTSTPFPEGPFAYSPAAKKFAYECFDYNQDICLVDQDGKNPINITTNDARDVAPLWTPDGKHILFISDRSSMSNVWQINTDGTDAVNLSNVYVSEVNPSLSPDGQKILMESQRDENWDIFTMGLDGKKVTNLSNTASPIPEHNPVWSPDGKYIAFFSERDGGKDIFVMNADGSNPINLTKTKDEAEFTFIWSADSQSVIYSSMNGESMNIFKIDREGKQTVNLTNGPGDSADPQWISN